MAKGSGGRRAGSVGFGHLPLFWKLLIPFVLLLIVVGSAGAFLIVRTQATQAQGSLNEALAGMSLDVRGHLQARELYLLESANLAANVRGMAEAVVSADNDAAAELLGSVLALKPDLTLVAVTDAAGQALAEFHPGERGGAATQASGRDWSDNPAVAEVLAGEGERKHAALSRAEGAQFTVAAPICSDADCTVVGVAVVGLDLHQALEAVVAEVALSTAGVTLFDLDGQTLARVGVGSVDSVEAPAGDEVVRVSEVIDGVDVQTAHSILEAAGERRGVIAVSRATDPVFASVRETAVVFGLVLVGMLFAIVGIGAWLSRSILRQVDAVVVTNRALGEGDLTARAPVIAEDEIGEIARGLNAMAEQLQASHEHLESRVEQRTKEVERLLAERSKFFAFLSHELRTPIAVILSGADLMLSIDDADGNDAGRMIKQSGGQLLGIVNDILDLARTEAGRIEVNALPTHLSDVVEGLRSMVDGLAQTSGVAVQLDVADDLPAVLADPVRVHEVLMNLVDNAVKYTPSGGSVLVEATAEDGMVRCDVSDTGPGIAADVGERIFEAFYRVDDVVPQHGLTSTGIGLALTRGLVEAHGGTLTYSSVVGEGSTFTFTLPLAMTDTPDSADVLAGTRGGARPTR